MYLISNFYYIHDAVKFYRINVNSVEKKTVINILSYSTKKLVIKMHYFQKLTVLKIKLNSLFSLNLYVLSIKHKFWTDMT